jgi:sugar (pentulose or hexulose) kinase
LEKVIAVDLGASSGRVINVSFEGNAFNLKESFRFSNIPVQDSDTLRWNIKQLWSDTVKGIKKAQNNILCIGVDSWGVDYGLLDKNGRLLNDPVHYRDTRTKGMMEWVFNRIPRWTIFQMTGVQTLELNTLFQLASQVRKKDVSLKKAKTYLGIPDIFNYWLTGVKKAEYTHASTTQIYTPFQRDWCYEIIKNVGIPVEIFPEIVQPGTFLGEYNKIPVCAPACHDTGSAVTATPITEKNFAYISSGTWSLLGTEIKKPLITLEAYNLNYTNEGGADNNFRLLKNIPGLWLEQELLREWKEDGNVYSYPQINESVKKSKEFKSIINPNDPMFFRPGKMSPRIKIYCKETNQHIPKTIGEYLRCIYESLVLNYKYELNGLKKLTKTPKIIHIVGGGSKNSILNQMTSNATGIRVLAGPDEATALGNAIVQLRSLDLIKDIKEGRRIILESVDTETYVPESDFDWDKVYERFLDLKTKFCNYRSHLG